MKRTCYEIDSRRCLKPFDPKRLSASWLDDPVERWVDIEAPSEDELQGWTAPLGLPQAVIKACMEPQRSMRFASYEQALYLEYPMHLDADGGRRPYLSIICLPTTLVTVHRDPVPALAQVTAEMCGEVRLRGAGTSFLLTHLLTALGAENFDAILRVRDEADALAQRLDEDPGSVDAGDLLSLRRRLDRFTITLEDQLYCIARLTIVESVAFDVKEQRDRYRDMAANGERGVAVITRIENRLQHLSDHYQIILQDKANNRLKVLTIISAVFLPATLVAGIYGMNFTQMPGLSAPYGFGLVIGGMVALLVGLLWVFKRAGWY